MKYCKHCLTKLNDEIICPNCGNPVFNDLDTSILRGKYLIGETKEENEVYIEYIGLDLKTEKKVLIFEAKELIDKKKTERELLENFRKQIKNSKSQVALKEIDAFVETDIYFVAQEIQVNDKQISSNEKKRNRIAVLVFVLIMAVVTIIVCNLGQKVEENSRELVKEDVTTVTMESAVIGDHVSFGRYEQDNLLTNGNEDIIWVVLDKDGDKLLLLSLYSLDSMVYDEPDNTDVSWENCIIRNWLNKDFLNSAFTREEKNRIIETEIIDYADTNKASTTKDKVFLLSIPEVEQYIPTQEDRKAIPSEYAVNNGAVTSSYYRYCSWWLRYKGIGNKVAMVGSSGELQEEFIIQTNSWCTVRPAIWVTL